MVPTNAFHECMQKHAGFRLWDLCKEMELRFSRAQSFETPDHMAYYIAFHLHECDMEHTWIYFLDRKYRLYREQKFLQKTVAQRNCAGYICKEADKNSYFYIASVCENLSSPLSDLQSSMRNAYSDTFQQKPKYLGMILVTRAMDYRYLPPNPEW